MNATILATIAISLYAFGAIYEAFTKFRASREPNILPLICGVFGATLHALALYSILSAPHINQFSLVNSLAMTACLAVYLFVAISFTRPIQSILLIVYPVSALSVIALLVAEPIKSTSHLSLGVVVHISLSILAYSVLSLAAGQALLVVLRNKGLKHHRFGNWLDKLPPLLIMESLLFDLLRSGTILLGGAITLGFLFVEDLFAQHLAHKTFFSIVSLMLYATLLYGRKRYGWRGSLAGTLTLWSTGFLMLGFFGTKFVIEAIL